MSDKELVKSYRCRVCGTAYLFKNAATICAREDREQRRAAKPKRAR